MKHIKFVYYFNNCQFQFRIALFNKRTIIWLSHLQILYQGNVKVFNGSNVNSNNRIKSNLYFLMHKPSFSHLPVWLIVSTSFNKQLVGIGYNVWWFDFYDIFNEIHVRTLERWVLLRGTWYFPFGSLIVAETCFC